MGAGRRLVDSLHGNVDPVCLLNPCLLIGVPVSLDELWGIRPLLEGKTAEMDGVVLWMDKIHSHHEMKPWESSGFRPSTVGTPHGLPICKWKQDLNLAVFGVRCGLILTRTAGRKARFGVPFFGGRPDGLSLVESRNPTRTLVP